MQLSHPRQSSAGVTGIVFPMLECWNAMTKVATLAADVNKKRVLCRVSLDVLIDKFGALDEAPMLTVARQRKAIQGAARRLIERDVYEEDGSVLIRACDL